MFVIAIEHRPGRGSSRISGSTSSGGGGGGGLVVFFLFLLMNWVGPSSA